MGAEFFTAPEQVNQRRYEALRGFFVEGLTHAQAGQRFGYTRWAMVNLVREHRAGKLELFAPPRKPGPPPGTAPAKDHARARVIELRRGGPVDLRDLHTAGRRGHTAEPHERGGDPHRGGIRAVAAPPRRTGQHRSAHPGTRHPATQDRGTGPRHLAGPGGVGQGRPVAAGARPGRP